MLRTFLALFAPLALGACAALPQSPSGHAPPAASPHPGGVVSAADPRAAEAGAAMLRQGGSATDAAIATMLALTVVEPQSSGIGGGGFLLRGTPDGEVETLDGRETAPVGADPQWFLGPDGEPLPFMEAVISGRSVGVPGNLRLAGEAHRRHGKLPWAALFEPAIALARDGWVLSERAREFLFRARNRAAHQPEGRALYYDAAGEALPAGSTLRNPALAQTLAQLASEGPDSFYSGPNAAAIAATVAAETPRAGAMTINDIAAYQAKERPELCGPYRGYRICGMGPPSSGATTVYAILKQLERFDLAALGAESPVFWHLFAESQRLAFADRERWLADSDFVTVPAAELMDPGYLARRGALIDPARRLPTAPPGMPGGLVAPPDGEEPQESGTSHFVAIDREGNAVSYTSTIEGSFGSGLMVGGYYLNNELTDFSFVPAGADGRAVANRVEGGKRPRSSMAPTLVYDADGELVIAVGAAGGATIPVQVARALIGAIDFDLPLEQAIGLPLLFAPSDQIAVEQGSALEAMIPQLEALGHAEIAPRALPLKANGAQRTAAGWIGAVDPRSEGAAIRE